MSESASNDPSRAPSPSGARLDSLQALRALAALAVVFHHAGRAVTVNRPAGLPEEGLLLVPSARLVEVGSIGVDLFFILSGFLMIHISGKYRSGERSIGDFLAQRMIRIWPLYGLVTLFVCLPLVRSALIGGSLPFDFQPARLASLLFVPSFNEKGLLLPILAVGWTLNYEMLFYLCFAFSLLLARRHLLIPLSALIGSLFLIGQVAPAGALAAFLDNGIIFEFLLGTLLAEANAAGRLPRLNPAIWLVASLLVLLFTVQFETGVLPRALAFGLPAALFLTGMVSLERSVTWPRLAILLGNASYSIYLVHLTVIYQISRPAFRALAGSAAAEFAVPVVALAAMLGSVSIGLLCFRCIETPLLRSCHSAYRSIAGRRSRSPAAELARTASSTAEA